MAGYTRGKKALKISLDKQHLLQKRRVSPQQEAEYMCRVGLDKEGLERRYINKHIGFGVFATTEFSKGAFLLEYVGQRLSASEAKEREIKRSRKIRHSYQYFYKWNGYHCIDATESSRLCKFVNDAETGSPMNNAVMKLLVFRNQPKLCLFAARDIKSSEEVRYDYGEKNLPWRESSTGYSEFDAMDDMTLSQAMEKYQLKDEIQSPPSNTYGDKDFCYVREYSDDDDPFDLASGIDEGSSLFKLNSQDVTADVDSAKKNLNKMSTTVLDIENGIADVNSVAVDVDSATADVDSAETDVNSVTADLDSATGDVNSVIADVDGATRDTKELTTAVMDMETCTADVIDMPVDSAATDVGSVTLEMDCTITDVIDNVIEDMTHSKTDLLDSAREMINIVSADVVKSATEEVMDSVSVDVACIFTTDTNDSASVDVVEVMDIASTDVVNIATSEIMQSAPADVIQSASQEVVDSVSVDVANIFTTDMKDSFSADVVEVMDIASTDVVNIATSEIMQSAPADVIQSATEEVVDSVSVDVANIFTTDMKNSAPAELVEVMDIASTDVVNIATSEIMHSVPADIQSATADREQIKKKKMLTKNKCIDKKEVNIKEIESDDDDDDDDDESYYPSSDDESYYPSSESEECETDDASYSDDHSDKESYQPSNKDKIDPLGELLDGSESDDLSASFPMLNGDNVQKITFLTARKSESGVYNNKVHACVYCEKLMANMARHLELVHASEIDVAQILVVPKRSKERRKLWQKLINKGDFNHNYYVMEQGKGVVIPKYRKVEEDADLQLKNYVPCQYCKALYKKYDLWKHKESCVARPKDSKSGEHIKPGRLLLPPSCSNQGLEDNILKVMKDDDTKSAVIADHRILDLGSRLFDKHGHEHHKFQYISQKLRELGRLLVCSKEMYRIKSVDELLHSSNFDKLIQTVRKLCGYEEESKTFAIPSLALKLGHSLQKCANYMKSEGLKENNQEKIDTADRFLTLYETEWCESISSHALSSLDQMKFNKPLLLPLVKDVVTLNKYMNSKIEKLRRDIKEIPELYSQLAQVCLAQVILFNRRRSGETERMSVAAFKEAISTGSGKPDEVVLETLTEFEKTLCNTHTRVEIKGKRGRKVPVLFTQEMKKTMEILISKREEANVTQPYLFARPGPNTNPYRGTDCVRKMSHEAELENPYAMTSTKLRKQLATLAQILNLSETSQDILATFQGHNIRVHREYYRLPENALQVAKVSKLLHSINNGTISEYQGKDFDEIEFVEKETVESESESESDSCNEDESEDVDEDVDEILKTPSQRKDNAKSTASTTTKEKKGMKARKVPTVRHVWTKEEKAALNRQFKTSINLGKTPGQVACLNAIKSERCLAGFSWQKIKFAVKNIITSRNRSCH